LIALPDVNVLLALAWAQHQHHEAAHAWFGNAAGDGWATCLLTQTAFVRLSMNPQVVHVAIECQAARDLLSGLVAHPKHQFVEAGPTLTSTHFDPLASRVRGYRQMTDATLIFLAKTQDLKLVTFDHAALSLSPWPEVCEILIA